MKLKIIAIACVAIAPFALAQTGSGPTSTGERDIAAAPTGEISYVNEFTPGNPSKSPERVSGHNLSFTDSRQMPDTLMRLGRQSIRAIFSPVRASGSRSRAPDQVSQWIVL